MLKLLFMQYWYRFLYANEFEKLKMKCIMKLKIAKNRIILLCCTFLCAGTLFSCAFDNSVQSNTADNVDGDGNMVISGELQQWHKITLDLAGPYSSETETGPNPFTDFRYEVTFVHESGTPAYTIPGYFAADGNAAESGAESGNIWRAHLSPDKTGKWSYSVSFVSGLGIAISESNGKSVAPFDG